MVPHLLCCEVSPSNSHITLVRIEQSSGRSIKKSISLSDASGSICDWHYGYDCLAKCWTKKGGMGWYQERLGFTFDL